MACLWSYVEPTINRIEKKKKKEPASCGARIFGTAIVPMSFVAIVVVVVTSWLRLRFLVERSLSVRPWQTLAKPRDEQRRISKRLSFCHLPALENCQLVP